jgi:hypothetical protein
LAKRHIQGMAIMPNAETSGRTHNPAFDRAKTCSMTLYGDGRTRPKYFDPRLLRAIHAIHQELEVIYCEPHGGTAYGDCAGDEERED